MKTFIVTFTGTDNLSHDLTFKAADRSKAYNKASAHAREYYNCPMRITVTEQPKQK